MSHSSSDDDVSLSSSRLELIASGDGSTPQDLPQMYTRDDMRDKRIRRKKTREEEILSDEEYLEPVFKESDREQGLTLDQNLGLFLLRTNQDFIGGRHLSVGLDQRPDLDHITDEPEEKLERRRSSFMEGVSTQLSKYHIWDDELHKDRLQILTGFLINYFVLGAGFMIVLGIYWGTLYHRNYRYPNMRMLVVLDDQEVGVVPPLIGETVAMVSEMESVKMYGGWHVWNHTEFTELALSNNNTVEQEVYRQIHHRLYWGAIYVKLNATWDLYEKLTNSNTSIDTGRLIDAVYETGRDPILVSSYVTDFIYVFENLFIELASSNIYPRLVSMLNDDQLQDINSNALTQTIYFHRLDRLPMDNPVIFAPLQLGLVYIVVFAFFQFVLSIRVHLYVASRVKGVKYILFRMITSHVLYLILSLAYSTLNAAYGLNFRANFGNSGFLVMWSVGYLEIASLGSLNENVLLLVFTFFKPLIGLWLVFLMSSNVSPTFSPISLCPTFYRYGYLLPIHNSYELFKVIFFDGYKGQMGRNVGVLVAWIVVCNACLPFTLRYVAKLNKRNLERDAKKLLLKKKGSN